MKKFITYLVSITFVLLLCTACGSSKKGCGLTADNSKTKITTSNNTIVAEAR